MFEETLGVTPEDEALLRKAANLGDLYIQKRSPKGFYRLREADSVHFIKLALHFDEHPELDPYLYMEAAWHTDWTWVFGPKSPRGNKSVWLPLPYMLYTFRDDILKTYRKLQKMQFSSSAEEAQILRGIEASVAALKRTIREPSVLTNEDILQAYFGSLVTAEFLSLIPGFSSWLETQPSDYATLVSKALLSGKAALFNTGTLAQSKKIVDDFFSNLQRNHRWLCQNPS